MSKKTKKITYYVSILLLIASAILIFFNLSQIQGFQIKIRNDQRQKDVNEIASKVEKYIKEEKKCPTTSNPVPKSYLPELIFDKKIPRGGINVNTLEDMGKYLGNEKKDPEGNPYSLGIFEGEIIVYNSHVESINGPDTVYFKTIDADLCNVISE